MACENVTRGALVKVGAVPAAADAACAIQETVVRRTVARRLNRQGPTADSINLRARQGRDCIAGFLMLEEYRHSL